MHLFDDSKELASGARVRKRGIRGEGLAVNEVRVSTACPLSLIDNTTQRRKGAVVLAR
jgi:hypothetical protein